MASGNITGPPGHEAPVHGYRHGGAPPVMPAGAAKDRDRLTALQGLAALSLDALSSVAYRTPSR